MSAGALRARRGQVTRLHCPRIDGDEDPASAAVVATARPLPGATFSPSPICALPRCGERSAWLGMEDFEPANPSASYLFGFVLQLRLRSAQAGRRRSFAHKLRHTDLQLRSRFQQTIFSAGSGQSRASSCIRYGSWDSKFSQVSEEINPPGPTLGFASRPSAYRRASGLGLGHP